jgi:hypothetical protein
MNVTNKKKTMRLVRVGELRMKFSVSVSSSLTTTSHTYDPLGTKIINELNVSPKEDIHVNSLVSFATE